MEYNVYHGTEHVFSEFQCPAYFTDNLYTARFFAFRGDGTPRILHCTVNLCNPLIADLEGQSWGGFFLKDTLLQNQCVEYISCGDEDEKAYFSEEGLTVGFLKDYAESCGYDGLILYNCLEEDGRFSNQYVAFEPQSITIHKNI